MCNEYAREIEIGRVIKLMERMKSAPPFAWEKGRIPNDLEPKSSIKIRDTGIVVGLEGDHLAGRAMTWAWMSPQGKPVFNFVSEGRDFSKSTRVLIPATGFYEYTTPKDTKIKLKDRDLFTLKGEEWFWIAGIVKDDCFTMLTAAPGPDLKPFHDRQICVLNPASGMDWLALKRPESGRLKTPPRGTFAIRTLRQNGITSD